MISIVVPVYNEADNIAPLLRDLVRDDVVLSAHTWVVKVGTSVLTGDAAGSGLPA